MKTDGKIPDGSECVARTLNPDAILQRGILATSCGSATLALDFPASASVSGR
jgi:hypothetical protein